MEIKFFLQILEMRKEILLQRAFHGLLEKSHRMSIINNSQQINFYQNMQQRWFMKNALFLIKNIKFWHLEFWIRKREQKKVPSFVIVGFFEDVEFDEQNRDNSVFDCPSASFDVCRLEGGSFFDNYLSFDYPGRKL